MDNKMRYFPEIASCKLLYPQIKLSIYLSVSKLFSSHSKGYQTTAKDYCSVALVSILNEGI